MDSGSNTPDTMEKPGVGHNTDGNGDSPTTVDDRQTLDRISNLIETSGAQVEQIEGWLDHFTPKKRAQLKQQVTLTPEPESVRELETHDGMLAVFKQMQLLQEQMQAVMRENAELKRTVQLQQTDTKHTDTKTDTDAKHFDTEHNDTNTDTTLTLTHTKSNTHSTHHLPRHRKARK